MPAPAPRLRMLAGEPRLRPVSAAVPSSNDVASTKAEAIQRLRSHTDTADANPSAHSSAIMDRPLAFVVPENDRELMLARRSFLMFLIRRKDALAAIARCITEGASVKVPERFAFFAWSC